MAESVTLKKRAVTVAAITVLTVAVVAALELSPPALATSGHCNIELDRGGRYYTPWRVHGSRPGAKLPGRAKIRCEHSIVCKRNAGCVSTPGKVLASVRVRALPGIDERDALANAVTGQVYVDPERCSLTDARVLHCGIALRLTPIRHLRPRT